MWIWLNADRGLGTIHIEPQKIVGGLGKTEAQITEDGEPLRNKVCQPTAAGAIQIPAPFWPYEREPTSQQAETPATYVSHIKRLFLARRCVRSAFAAADESLAAELYHAGMSIQDAEHAILLGALRKYVTLINNGRGTPITSLRHFTALFEEVKLEIPPGYWTRVARRVRKIERQRHGFEAGTQTK